MILRQFYLNCLAHAGKRSEPSALSSQPYYTTYSEIRLTRSYAELGEVMVGMAIHQHARRGATAGRTAGGRATPRRSRDRRTGRATLKNLPRSQSHWAVSTRVSSSGAVSTPFGHGATKMINCLMTG